MKIGLQLPYFGDQNEIDLPEFLKLSAQAAENSGFDSLWVMDHLFQIPFVGSYQQPMLEAYTALSFVSGITRQIKLGALVTAVVHRNPALLAKTVTSLDVLSNGRAILGIGASWYELEQESYGYNATTLKERFERLEEAVIINKLLFTQDSPTFEGKYYRIKNCFNNPRPVSKNGPPILIGGGGEKKTLALVAKYADACNVFGSLETLRRKIQVLKDHCKDVSRNFKEITITQLTTLVTADTEKQLDQKLNSLSKLSPNWNEQDLAERALVGTKNKVIKEIKRRRDIGLDAIIVNLPGLPSKEDITLAGQILTEAFNKDN